MSLSLLKSIHLVDFPKDSSLSNVLGTVWAAKPKIRAGQQQLPVLPQGFIQPSKNSTPFHYAFPTASRRVTCACCLFCVARTFAGVHAASFVWHARLQVCMLPLLCGTHVCRCALMAG
jgi:hypothetical protein